MIYKIEDDAIRGFKEKPFDWLSNMHYYPIKYLGQWFSCSETAYQQSKFFDPEIRDRIRDMDGYEAKRYARVNSRSIRPDFLSINESIMEDILRCKFARGTPMGYMLSYTGTRQLVEVVWWNDPFWGVRVQDGVGENRLGELLMRIREDLI